MFQKTQKAKTNEDGLDVLARRATDKFGEIETKIGRGINLNGSVEGNENLRLNGGFEGRAKVSGMFILGQSGKFKGDLSADNIIIEGDFDGKVLMSNKIELRNTARFRGSIHANAIAIAEGSFFEGEVKMSAGGKGQQFSFQEKRKIKTDKS